MKIKDITIREFRMTDYENVFVLWAETGIHYKPNGRENRQRLEKELETERALFLVAEVDKRIVGVVLGTHDGHKGWINRLAVQNRQNIASKLVTTVETRLNEQGIDVIACLIKPENSISKSFFSKLGYTKAPVEYFSKKQSPDS